MSFAPLLLRQRRSELWACASLGKWPERTLSLHASAGLLTAGPAGLQLDYDPRCSPDPPESHPTGSVCSSLPPWPHGTGIVRLLCFLTYRVPGGFSQSLWFAFPRLERWSITWHWYGLVGFPLRYKLIRALCQLFCWAVYLFIPDLSGFCT